MRLCVLGGLQSKLSLFCAKNVDGLRCLWAFLFHSIVASQIEWEKCVTLLLWNVMRLRTESSLREIISYLGTEGKLRLGDMIFRQIYICEGIFNISCWLLFTKDQFQSLNVNKVDEMQTKVHWIIKHAQTLAAIRIINFRSIAKHKSLHHLHL